MKKALIFASALAILVGFTSCKKEKNDINLDDNNLSAYCKTRNHDNWDARVFKLTTSEFNISIKP